MYRRNSSEVHLTWVTILKVAWERGQTGAGGSAQPAPVAENVVQKEAVSYQSASGVGTGAGATSQSNLVQGTSTTRQHLLNDRQLVGRADAKTMLQSMGVQFPTITLPDGRGGHGQRNVLAAHRSADRA